ncbi:MAG: 50S ribosomal protein L24 [Simkaniaceae bacterium]|nr:50S ribosomal protein L24 [Simkaniaceae bacterium]
MTKRRIKKGDRVVAISGNEKGNHGVVLGFKKDRIVVQGLNVRKKHMKQRSEETRSEIISIECPIHISNVALCDPDGKPLKLKVVNEEGVKELKSIEGTEVKTFRTLKKAKK